MHIYYIYLVEAHFEFCQKSVMEVELSAEAVVRTCSYKKVF